MPCRFAAFAITLLASTAAAQPAVERVLQFDPSMTAEQLTEAGAGIRFITSIEDVTADEQQRTLAVRGSSEQVALAEWLFAELTRPQPPAPTDGFSTAPDYRYDIGQPDNLVRVLHLRPELTVQQVQEIATAARTISDIRRVYAYNASRSLFMRGDRGQLALATWVIEQFDGPEEQVRRDPPWPEFEFEPLPRPGARQPGAGEVAARVFHLDPQLTVQEFQEVATLIRTITGLRRVYTYNERHSMALRGTAEQVELAEWVLAQVRQNPPETGGLWSSDLYRTAEGSDDLVRVFHLSADQDREALMRLTGQLARSTQPKRMFATSLGILAARGTLDQLRLIEESLQSDTLSAAADR